MAQNNTKTAIETKDRSAQRKTFLWSELLKKLLLPASILYVVCGLALAGYNAYQMTLVSGGQETAVSLGMLISNVIVGVIMLAAGVLGLIKNKKFRKVMMTLGVVALVYSIIILTATAATGWIAIVSGVVVIVLSLFYIIAVDGAFETGLIRFFREMFGELKKLTWLSGKELFSHTLAVLVFVLAMAALIYLLDLAFAQGFGALSSIKIG